MKTISKCEICGKEFEHYGRRRFCSNDCTNKWRKESPSQASDIVRHRFMHKRIERSPFKKFEISTIEGKKRNKEYAERKEYLNSHSILDSLKTAIKNK